jgi:hypothetical protein
MIIIDHTILAGLNIHGSIYDQQKKLSKIAGWLVIFH